MEVGLASARDYWNRLGFVSKSLGIRVGVHRDQGYILVFGLGLQELVL